MGQEMSIHYISNATRRQADAIVAYNVKMVNVADSSAIRKKFGTFFLGGKDQRPEALKPYSIKNRITPETKIQIDILKLLAQHYRDANQVFVQLFLARFCLAVLICSNSVLTVTWRVVLSQPFS